MAIEFEKVEEKEMACTNCGKKHNPEPSTRPRNMFPVCIKCKLKERERLKTELLSKLPEHMHQMLEDFSAAHDYIRRYVN